MPSDQITIAEILKDAGYYTAHIGKWHLGLGWQKLPNGEKRKAETGPLEVMAGISTTVSE